MKHALHSRLLTLLALCAILASLLPAIPVQAAAPRQSSPPAPASEIDTAEDKLGILSVTLSSSGAVTPGGTASLTLAATPATDLAVIEVQWQLPDGGELIGGSEIESFSAVAANGSVQSSRQVRFPNEGVYRVMASATASLNDSVTVAPLGVLFFTVNSAAQAVSNRDPNPVDPRAGPMVGDIISAVEGARVVDPATVDAASISETDDPCFTVKGRVTRSEQRIINNNTTTTTGVAVANAVIEMREEDTLFDDSYGTKLTDAAGNYSFSFCDDDGIFDDELELYVRLRAELKNGGFTVVEVEDSSWIDEVYEFDSGVTESEGGNYTIDFNLNTERSAIFNIADAVWRAWDFWNDSGGDTDGDGVFDYSAEVHWEPGYGDDGSYYYWVWAEMTIADDPSDPDEWDDSVIMHEWGHMADDKYGCDDNPGGDHSVDQIVDPELAWGEGYPDYYQSAVRQANGYVDSNFYLDRNGGGGMMRINLETYDSTRTDDKLVAGNELAIAAMLWDFNDTGPDGRIRNGNPETGPWDTVNHGHAMIQRAYTEETFESNGDVFDDTCSAFVYLLSWDKMGLPTDGPTAEVVVKNVQLANIFSPSASSASSASANGQAIAASGNDPVQPADPGSIEAAPSGEEDYQWWKRVTMVVDNSASMAGAKIDGIKAAIKEQANDIAPVPEGAQFKLFTFNNLSTGITPRYTSLFRAPDVNQGIDQLTASGAADPSCPTNGLSSLAQAAQTMRGGQAWLYTDGDSYATPSAAAMKQLLNDRGVRGSVVLLVGCGTLPPSQPNRTGAEMAYLGNAADASQPTGIVPYLLTALGSGGQFFYVNQNQLGAVGDVLRAQLGHSAGAGKWSDYVSDEWTYRWDKIDPPDYQWFPVGLSQIVGRLSTFLDVSLGTDVSFPYWGDNRSVARVYQDGYLRWDPCTGLLCPIFSTAYIEPLRSDLGWAYIPQPPSAAAASEGETAPLDEEMTTYPWANLPATDEATVGPLSAAEVAAKCYADPPNLSIYTEQVMLYRANLGINEWIILTTVGESDLAGNPCRDFQVWLNVQDGRIRFLYNRVYSQDAGASRIGLRQVYAPVVITPPPPDEVIVSNMQIAGATNNMGYTFTPAPPQPTRTHTVTVDALMESIGFLQTGYSGNFEPMVVKDPSGVAVDCSNTADVLCLSVDNVVGDRMVQYVQVDVNGRTGVWSATIDGGNSGSSTYSFTGMAASEIEAQGTFDHQRASFKTGPLLLRLGTATTGNTLTGWMTKVNGVRWGNEFTLYDDGLHGDGQAGDGQFGLLDLTPPGEGVGYLWVKGAIGGQNFQRMDPAPLNFQPFELRSLNAPVLPNEGAPIQLWFSFENHDSVERCFTPSFTAPEGWIVEWDLGTGYPCVAAGATVNDYITVYPDWTTIGATDAGDEANAAAIQADVSGSIAVIGIAAQDTYNDAIADAAETRLMRTRPADRLIIDERPFGHYYRANSTDTVTVTVQVLDEQGVAVADGTPVSLSTTLGTLAQTSLFTVDGFVSTILTAPAAPGDATVTATSNGKSDTAVVYFRNPIANQIVLAATPTNLALGTTSAIVATVTDAWGDPVVGAKVRIGVDGDGQVGSINGGEVISGTTNAAGQVLGTFTRAGVGWNTATLRAELLKATLTNDDVAHSASVTLVMGGATLPGGRGVTFLPIIRK